MKRVLMLCAAILIVMVAVTGSIAYFTDEVTVRDQVVVGGNLDIQQNEYERKVVGGQYTGELQLYTQEQQLYPCVKVDDSTMNVDVGGHVTALPAGLRNYVDKIVNVHNKGSLQAYVRTIVATPARYTGEAQGIDWLHLVCNTGSWTWQNNLMRVTIDGVLYDLHVGTCSEILQPGAYSTPSLLGYYLDPRVSNSGDHLVYVDESGVKHDLGKESMVTILVATQAAQAHPDVFENVTEAMEKTYGVISEINHPWVDAEIVANQTQLEQALASARYTDVIALKDGTYTLPAALPAGVKLVGWGTDVNVAGGAVAAKDVELNHLTFTGALAFTGNGSFKGVEFLQGVSASITPENGVAANKLLFESCRMDHCTVTQQGNTVEFLNCLKLDGTALSPVVDGIAQ